MTITGLMRVACGVVLAVLCFTCAAMGQTETATISGLITDDTGAVMPGAEVKLQNIERGTSSSATTNKAGIYVFASVHPGPYQLTVHKPGFRQVDLLNLIVNVQDHIEQNFRLQLGSVAESVTVTANGLNVNTTDGAVSTVIDRNFIESLPLNGRSFNTLLQLTPGIVIAPSSTASPGQFSVAGQRTDANNFTVDGVSANFGVIVGQFPSGGTGGAQAFSALGGTSSLVSVDALQEFRIETSSFAPEFGKTPGGQVILTTRSGTNEFHGGAYDYFRNDVMDANDWFANSVGNPRAAERHNDFGGFLGGPIWRDKTFFFFSYEGARLREPQTQVVQVPSQDARTSAPAGVAPFLAAYPNPNGPVSPDDTTAQFTGTFSNAATLNATSLRLDYLFNSRFSIFARYNYAPSHTANRVFGLSTVETAEVNTQTVTVGLNMSLGSRIYNTLRGNYSSQKATLDHSLDSFGGAVPVTLGQFLGSFSSTDAQGAFLVFNANDLFVGSNSRNRSKQMNFTDDLSLTLGTHQIRIGGDYRGIFADFHAAAHDVDFLGTTVQSLVSTNAALLLAGTFAPSRILSQSLSLYGQDSWKVSRRLALTYGLRWEISPAPKGLGSTTLASWTHVNDPAEITLAPIRTPLWRTTYSNFAPRLGIAYDLTSTGDFVLRGGIGVFYDLGVGSVASVGSSFPNGAFAPITMASFPIADIGPSLPVLSTQPPYLSPVTAFAPDLKLPRSYQWNIALEKSFGGNQSISATYVGQGGRDLLRQAALFQPNPNFTGEFLLSGNSARSNYNALQVQYRRPFAKRVHLLLNYSWSHSLDNASNDVVAGLSGNIISAANDYASSNFDVRHSFSGALIYALPAAAESGLLSVLTRDWSISTAVVARTGFPGP